MERVQKLLSNYGYCSRRRAEELIEQGKVKVNGKIINLGDQASEKDEITVNGESIVKERKVYIIFNKPPGCVTALTDDRHKTVMAYIKVKERVFPIGRLDANTSGLLLLTNDGDFANRIMHPRNEINKTYLVSLDRQIKEADMDRVERGVFIGGRQTSPARLIKKKNRELEITIHEGMNRVVKKIFAVLGYKVITLKRVKIGKLYLGALKPGRFRHMTQIEKDKIFLR